MGGRGLGCLLLSQAEQTAKGSRREVFLKWEKQDTEELSHSYWQLPFELDMEGIRASPGKEFSVLKNLPAMQIQSLGQEDPLEEGMATHSSILAWRIPWTEEPGGLQSMGSQSDTTEAT